MTCSFLRRPFQTAALAIAFGVAAGAAPFFERTDLFEVPNEGYLSYRIPCIVVTKRGTVLAFATARRSVSDWAQTNLMLHRSTDGGKTWEPHRIVAQDGRNTVDNATAIADRRTGAVHVLYQINYSRLFYLHSEDEGATFSPAVDITPALERLRASYNWNVAAPGPGHGLQLQSGRLIVPVWLSTGGKTHRPSVVTTLTSDDHGKTWQPGEIVPPRLKNMNESAAVQLADGRVALFIRNEEPGAYRHAISSSPDGATKWSEPVLQDELYSPICFATAIRFDDPDAPHGESRLLFVHPDSRSKTESLRAFGARPRENLTVRVSADDAKTWPVAKVVEPGRSGYADLAVSPDGTIYCLYERGFIEGNNLNTRFLSVARFNLEWLTGGENDAARQVSLPAASAGRAASP